MSAALLPLENRLALFVEGMLGEYLHIRPRSAFAGEATLGAFSAQAPDTLYLPDELPNGSPAAYRVLAMRQVAQRLFGTFELRLAALLEQYPTLGELTPETLPGRAGELQRLRARYRYGGLFQLLFEAFEAIRLDAATVRAFPGLQAPLLGQLRDSAALSLDPLHLLPQQLDRLHGRWWTAHTSRLSTTACADAEADALVGILHDPASTVATSVLLADTWYKRMPISETPEAERLTTPIEVPEPELAEQIDASGDWMERDARLKDWQEELAALEGMLLNPDLTIEEDAEVGERPGLAGAPRPEDQHLDQRASQPELERERDQLSRRIDMERAALRHALGRGADDSRSFRYPEWDYLEQRYRDGWCTLYELPLDGEQRTDSATLRNRIRSWRDEIRQRLAQIRPMGYERRPAVEDGDELDLNAVLNAQVDSAAGLAPDERVYSRRDRARRDLCAAFLVDLSASTDDPVEKPEPEPFDPDADLDAGPEPIWTAGDPAPAREEPRRIIDVQREAMLAMAAALEQLGDEYGVYGFSGYGRDCVEYYVAKELGQSFTPQTLHDIAAMKPRRSTRMGPAIRHTVEKLKRSGQQMKLLIMLSDGFPQDCDYGPTRGDHEYGLEDTARALAEAEAVGIRTFCLTVDRSGNDYLKTMCPDEQYMVIEEVEALPTALSKVYRNLTQ
ncbi:MAG: hypothetical protein AAGG11_00725 [Pseudomonadota bacterium]